MTERWKHGANSEYSTLIHWFFFSFSKKQYEPPNYLVFLEMHKHPFNGQQLMTTIAIKNFDKIDKIKKSEKTVLCRSSASTYPVKGKTFSASRRQKLLKFLIIVVGLLPFCSVAASTRRSHSLASITNSAIAIALNLFFLLSAFTSDLVGPNSLLTKKRDMLVCCEGQKFYGVSHPWNWLLVWQWKIKRKW